MYASRGARALNTLAKITGIGLLIAAVVQELRKPSTQRSWHGQVGGTVPYDLRPPTLERLKRRLWDPSESRIIVASPFCVGWTLNFAALLRAIRER